MKLRVSLLLMCAAPAMLHAAALDVTLSAPGTLAAAVEEPAGVTSLAVSGSVDAADFQFIASEMPALTALDLSRATVAAYSGPAINGLRSYPADVLPSMILAGTGIESIAFPEGLTAIGDGALAGTRLRQVDVPAGVTATGEGAFAGCEALERASVAAGTLAPGAFAGCPALRRVAIPAGLAIPARCFAGDSLLEAVDGFDTAVAVGDRAFTSCASLEALPFGSKLCSIGAGAFSGSALREADLSGCAALSAVGEGAFSGCPSLERLEIPEGCEAAMALAMNTPALRIAVLMAADVPAFAFTGDSLVDISTAVAMATVVGDYAFKGVTRAGAVVLPASLEYLGTGAMEGVTGLESIDASLLEAVPELGKYVWAGVDQPSVVLYAARDVADAFAAAPQWRDFDVQMKSLDGIADASASDTPGLRAAFNGTVLLVDCGGDFAGSVTVTDVAGRILAILHPDSEGRAMLDTARWTNDIYLLGASSGQSIKIAR
ncbi:MAG: leucine-rich repeat domain-containing protein [Muribaculaceae bacterium]|nr:leucine-rich repeat domain-containing protein [Muribaculaceae bacterium]